MEERQHDDNLLADARKELDETYHPENPQSDERKDFTALKERLEIRLKDGNLRMLILGWQKGELTERWDLVTLRVCPLIPNSILGWDTASASKLPHEIMEDITNSMGDMIGIGEINDMDDTLEDTFLEEGA